MHTPSKITLSLVLLGLAGCNSTSAVEDDFGNSVRQMVDAQKANPEVSNNPDRDPVDGTDAERVVRVLKTYREDVAQPSDVRRDRALNISGNRQ